MRRWQCSLRERRDLAVVLVTGIVRLWMRHPARLLDVGVLNCRRTRALGITNTPYDAFTLIFLHFIQVPTLCGNSQGLEMWNSSRISHSKQGILVLTPPCSAFTFRVTGSLVLSHTFKYPQSSQGSKLWLSEQDLSPRRAHNPKHDSHWENWDLSHAFIFCLIYPGIFHSISILT